MNYVELVNSMADLKSSELFALLQEAIEQYAMRIGKDKFIIIYNSDCDIDIFSK